ncbi:hypothetical protein FPV67DRAFT_760162 [Lyophyllum atratum]|nr:hypothetical protein FPV67DRAFT_760162 [Lyophyllum atratum]
MDSQKRRTKDVRSPEGRYVRHESKVIMMDASAIGILHCHSKQASDPRSREQRQSTSYKVQEVEEHLSNGVHQQLSTHCSNCASSFRDTMWKQYYRLGGWIITEEEAIQWTARLTGKPVEDVDWDYALLKIRRHLWKYGVNLTVVTYPKDVDVFMVVTKSEPHVGWRRGDDPTQLKQFEMEKADALVLEALTLEGVKDTKFVTSRGWF